MNERQYINAYRKIKADFDRDCESLARTWRILHGAEPPRVTTSGSLKTKAIRKAVVANGGVPLGDVLLNVLRDMPPEFDTVDVWKVVEALENLSIGRTALTHALKRLHDDPKGPIEIVETGKGKRATRYRKRNSVAI